MKQLILRSLDGAEGASGSTTTNAPAGKAPAPPKPPAKGKPAPPKPAAKGKPGKPSAPAKAGKADKPAKEPRQKRNGVTRPADGADTAYAWSVADKLVAKGGHAKRSDVLKQCEAKGINPHTAATQFGRWRRFNGLKGRAND